MQIFNPFLACMSVNYGIHVVTIVPNYCVSRGRVSDIPGWDPGSLSGPIAGLMFA